MNFFKLFQEKSKFFLVYLGLFGLVNSLWASALLLTVNNKINGEPLPYFDEYDWMIYGGLVLMSFAFTALFQSYMIRLSYNLGNELSLSIFNKLRFTNFEEFLKLGEERVRTAMTDVRQLQNFPIAITETFNSFVMVVIGISYLFYIDVVGATLVFVVLTILAAIYMYRNQAIEDNLDAARDLEDVYQQNVNDFLRGFREIKMSTKRSDNIFSHFMTKNRNRANTLNIKGMIGLLGNEMMGTYAWYVMIGVIIFLLPLIVGMSVEANISFIVTLLYLMQPTNTLVDMMGDFIQMKVAIDRITTFDKTIHANSAVDRGHGDVRNINPSFDKIDFKDVTFEYLDEEDRSIFKLKPLNLTIKRGESIFITGGNGSGKSTFIKLLTGLVQAKSGHIYLNKHKITTENTPFYRDQISPIFTDNYLFTDNYDLFDLTPSNEQFLTLLQKMELDKIIVCDENSSKVRHTLSQGQQKRLALIYSMLENKDIFIFDEWAAEQDPVFRRYFYTKIIPELQAMGKTVIAVTHDDAYFDCAERLIKFDYGQIVQDEKIEKEALHLRDVVTPVQQAAQIAHKKNSSATS